MAQDSTPSVTTLSDGSAIGGVLRDKRVALNASIREVARQSGYSHGYISLIECGRRQPRARTVKRLLVALAEIEAAKTVAA